MSNRARLLETQLAASLAKKLKALSVYRGSEDTERKRPCVVLSVHTTGTNYMVKKDGIPGDDAELRAMVLVDESTPSGADALETLLAKVREAVETATLKPGWQFVHLEFTGDEAEQAANARAVSLLWTVIMI
jgi:hypothetical protein